MSPFHILNLHTYIHMEIHSHAFGLIFLLTPVTVIINVVLYHILIFCRASPSFIIFPLKTFVSYFCLSLDKFYNLRINPNGPFLH